MMAKTAKAPNPKVYQKVIPAGSKAARYPDQSSPAHERKLESFERRKQFISKADQVAESVIYHINWKIPGASEIWPRDSQTDFRFVTKYYPYAKGGPLLVDEPRSALELDRAWQKQVVLKQLGFRHLVIEEDSTLEHLLQQVGLL